MRLNCFILAVTVILLASPEAVSTTSETKLILVSKTKALRSVPSVNEINDEGQINRLLRGDKVDAHTKEDEERALPKLDRVFSDLTNDAATATTKLTRSKSFPSVTFDEELKAMKMFYKYFHNENLKPMFKHFATVQNLPPKQAAEKWGILQKFKTMSMEELTKDSDYLMWRLYKKYWDKHTPPIVAV